MFRDGRGPCCDHLQRSTASWLANDAWIRVQQRSPGFTCGPVRFGQHSPGPGCFGGKARHTCFFQGVDRAVLRVTRTARDLRSWKPAGCGYDAREKHQRGIAHRFLLRRHPGGFHVLRFSAFPSFHKSFLEPARGWFVCTAKISIQCCLHPCPGPC